VPLHNKRTARQVFAKPFSCFPGSNRQLLLEGFDDADTPPWADPDFPPLLTELCGGGGLVPTTMVGCAPRIPVSGVERSG
jgi:hypothetical protein